MSRLAAFFDKMRAEDVPVVIGLLILVRRQGYRQHRDIGVEPGLHQALYDRLGDEIVPVDSAVHDQRRGDDRAVTSRPGEVADINVDGVNDAPEVYGATGGVYAGAAQFDGVDDIIDLSSASVLATGTGSFTYEAWINPDALNSGRMQILQVGDDVSTDDALTLYVEGGVLKADLTNNAGPVGTTDLLGGVASCGGHLRQRARAPTT